MQSLATSGDVGLSTAHVVVVRRADGQRFIVSLEIARMVFFERIPFMSKVRRCEAVPILTARPNIEAKKSPFIDFAARGRAA